MVSAAACKPGSSRVAETALEFRVLGDQRKWTEYQIAAPDTAVFKSGMQRNLTTASLTEWGVTAA